MLGVRVWLGPDFKPFASPQAAGRRDHDHTEAMAMRARLVLLALVAVAAAAVRADGPPRRPDDRVRMEREAAEPPPIRVGNTQPDQGGLFVGGDYFSGSLYRCRYEAGWRFGDGSSVRGSLGGAPVTTGVTYQRPVWETECARCSLVLGTECGSCSEWYLGHGLAARFEFLVPRPMVRAGIDWYPAEGVQLRFGLDLLPGRRYWGWELSF
jgi:hypothetical protein